MKTKRLSPTTRAFLAGFLAAVWIGCEYGCQTFAPPVKGGSILTNNGTTYHKVEDTSRTPVYPAPETRHVTVIVNGEPTTQQSEAVVKVEREALAGPRPSIEISKSEYAIHQVIDTTATTQSSVAATQSDNPKGDLQVKPTGEVTVSGAFSIESLTAAAIAQVKQYSGVIAAGTGLLLLAILILVFKYGGAAIPFVGPVLAPICIGFPLATPIIIGVGGLVLIAFPSYIEKYPLITAIVFIVVFLIGWLWHSMTSGANHQAAKDIATLPQVPNSVSHPNPIAQAILNKVPDGPTS